MAKSDWSATSLPGLYGMVDPDSAFQALLKTAISA
jgi:hypothetical protein